MTEEQKLQWLQGLIEKGVNVAQINLGDGTQNFYVGKDGQVKAAQEDAQVVDAEEVSADTDKPLCVAINSAQRKKLEAAEEMGIIIYNRARKGYDKGTLASQALVAYLCGIVFCGDYTKDGCWKQGKRFDEAQYCQELFGFDVAGTRRKARSTGAGKSPIGWEKVDGILDQ